MHRSLFDEVRRFARPILLSAAAIALSIGSTPAIAGPSVYPTGVTIYNPQKAYNGYVVFSAPDGKTHMIDMNGNEVHRWDYYAFPAELIDPAKNGGKRGPGCADQEWNEFSLLWGNAGQPGGRRSRLGR
jgi:hypothetical protein